MNSDGEGTERKIKMMIYMEDKLKKEIKYILEDEITQMLILITFFVIIILLVKLVIL